MNSNTVFPNGGLYLITPDEADSECFLARVLPVLGSQIAILQYRNKLANTEQMREQATALLQHCRKHHIFFIINDDIRLAHELAADGVHLGEHDGDVKTARNLLGPKAIIGVSCYNSLALAEAAAADGANYIAFGAVFTSGTKPLAREASPELFSQAVPLNLPMVAIGGITPDNAARILSAGANFLAVIGAVFDAADPAVEVTKFISRFQQRIPGQPNEH
ncbi:MAG: thiamine phosphate synthase [Arenimonas sp.]